MLKLFVHERGSEKMLQFWLAEDNRNKIVSALTQIEAKSAICRLERERRMSSEEAQFAFASITAELMQVIEQAVNPRVIATANHLVEKYVLRALDAVQLGSAVVMRTQLSASQIRFISSDQALLNAAESEGFMSWNPAVGNWTS